MATGEFAAKGYDGARVDDIVAAAGISKNLVYHYFDSKEQLFLEVLEGAYSAMRQRQDEIPLAGLGAEEGMVKLVEYTFDHFVKTPGLISLLNTENLYKARHIRKSREIKAMYNPLVESIKHLLEVGQGEGVFRDNVDPIQLYISISGLSYFYLSNQWTLSAIFGVKLSAPQRLKERREHCVEMVMAYLRKH